MEAPAEVSDLDVQLALKLKAKYAEHFQNLVRMHLSFALDLNIDECDEPNDKTKSYPMKWGFPKKVKVSKELATENNCLTEVGINRMHKLMLYLAREENICQEGIFRRTGALTRQVQLKACLNEGVNVNFDENNFSVHDCASVLKNFLSELPEPLVTDVYYPMYCQISEWCKCDEFEARLLRSLQLLILLLPSNNAVLLKHVINLLHLTAKRVDQNKMSAMNLATLFTPHLLCPRKLTGEALHSNAQMLYQIVVFMIQCGPELFKIPAGLAADIRLYWHDKEKKKLSPKNCLNESTADSCVVNTVFSFVDREKTAQENVTNPTETALAQLYAHIQSLPESSKKRKLVKQFNKENGYGTPKRVLVNSSDKSHSLTKNISDSLKKHIFSKSGGKQKLPKVPQGDKFIQQSGTPETRFRAHPLKLFDKRLDCMECGCSDTSDETCALRRKSNNSIDEVDHHHHHHHHRETKLNDDEHSPPEGGNAAAAEDFEEREIDAVTMTTPITQPKKSILLRKSSSVHTKLVTINTTPVVSKSISTHFHGTLTSTPAPVCFTNDVLTPSPFCGSNEDMSPITMSAQKMPKSMQEVMMTPRSRQPVLAVSGSNTTNLLTKDKLDITQIANEMEKNKSNVSVSAADSTSKGKEKCFESCCASGVNASGSGLGSKENTNLSNQSGDSLTDTFREYLCSRSMLTKSIVDDSFSSRTGDFDPSSVSEDKLSDSLLYCLDNGTPVPEEKCECCESVNDEMKHVHETLL